MIYLDTHVVVWLYAGKLEILSNKARKLLEEETLLISPMCGLELQYLFETDRISEQAVDIISDLFSRLNLGYCPQSFETVAVAAFRENWTRDPFDRIITAQARLKGTRLLTKDTTIHKNYSKAVWD